MGEFHWSHDLVPSSPLYSVAERASETLRSMVEPADRHSVAAHWTTTGSGTLALRLHDPYASVSETFRQDELTGQNEWFSLNRVYRQLLSGRVHRLLGQLGPPPVAEANA